MWVNHSVAPGAAENLGRTQARPWALFPVRLEFSLQGPVQLQVFQLKSGDPVAEEGGLLPRGPPCHTLPPAYREIQAAGRGAEGRREDEGGEGVLENPRRLKNFRFLQQSPISRPPRGGSPASGGAGLQAQVGVPRTNTTPAVRHFSLPRLSWAPLTLPIPSDTQELLRKSKDSQLVPESLPSWFSPSGSVRLCSPLPLVSVGAAKTVLAFLRRARSAVGSSPHLLL